MKKLLVNSSEEKFEDRYSSYYPAKDEEKKEEVELSPEEQN
jgi:hypothetical protein